MSDNMFVTNIALLFALIVVIHEGRLMVRAYRDARRISDNPLEWFESAMMTLVHHGRASHMLALECSVYWYIARSWRVGPFIPAGARVFTCYRKSGYVTLVITLLGICIVEAIAMHILISRVNQVAAIVFTVVTIYTMLWIAADARATVMNPVLVQDGLLTIRWGMYFSEVIPVKAISRFGTRETDVPEKERMSLVPLGGTSFWLEFDEPISMRTLTGGVRPIRALALSPDDAGGLREALGSCRPIVVPPSGILFGGELTGPGA